MGWGWTFIVLGAVVVSIGAMMGYYGQILLRERPPTQISTLSERLLTPSQERLLGLLFRYQRDYALSKLIVGREGQLFFDDEERRKTVKVNFLTELYGSKENDHSRLSDFISLMESLPTEYVRFHPEARFDNPFVVSVIPEGVKYLREPK